MAHVKGMSDREQSRLLEMDNYIGAMKQLYQEALQANFEIYDIASVHTNCFKDITAEAILLDSRIIKILRYAIAPSISQMKFGQFVGLSSVGSFENSKVVGGTIFDSLCMVAEDLSAFVTTNIDQDRFVWIKDKALETESALQNARKWTCSIAAGQNAETSYRNWRKSKQETSIHRLLESRGYIKTKLKGPLKSERDLEIGCYTAEVRVQGRTIQKADVVFRSKINNKLVLIEAKAVGVELDATKRIKECSDKASDWRHAVALNHPIMVSVIAGFFSENNISNLGASDVNVVWEHKLEALDEYL